MNSQSFMAICIVSAIGILGGCDDRAVPDNNVYSSSAEQMRVTSPSGEFDAVLVRDPYGPAAGGGVDSNVYIVRKGQAIHMKTAHPFFSADPMNCGKVVWKREHLLEIHYELAYIHEFRNLWSLSEVENVGSTGERDFEIEIQLVPASESSALAPDGAFRRLGGETITPGCYK
jgi:hypothetical protein